MSYRAGARRAIARHEELTDSVMAGVGQREAELGAFGRKKTMRDLDENAAAVAELGELDYLRGSRDRARVVLFESDALHLPVAGDDVRPVLVGRHGHRGVE